MRLLLAHGARPELQDAGGDTALHCAVPADRPVVAAILCGAAGAAAALALRDSGARRLAP